jgi:riboflavin synthase
MFEPAARIFPDHVYSQGGRPAQSWDIAFVSAHSNMFTGIIEEVGEVIEIDDGDGFRTIHVKGRVICDDIRIGASIAVNGVCLTARSIAARSFSAEMSRETLDRTSLGSLKQGALVNLERPMRADDRFGGHIVQGHVDGVGRIHRFDREGDAWNLEIEYPEFASRYLVEKGSVAVDGISLTVAVLKGSTIFSVAIIPHTFQNTNLKSARPGDAVNLEVDILAKYVERMLSHVRND